MTTAAPYTTKPVVVPVVTYKMAVPAFSDIAKPANDVSFVLVSGVEGDGEGDVGGMEMAHWSSDQLG
jgi:hypothetical protein